MISDIYFPLIYYGFITVIVLFYCIPLVYIENLVKYPKINEIVGVPLILFFIITFIGFRNPYGEEKYFGDTYTYTLIYENLTDSDFGFSFLMKFCKTILGLNITLFFFVCSLLYVGLHFLALRKWFRHDVFFPFLVLITTMFFFSFGVNGVRTGLGFSLFFFALSRENVWVKYIFMFLSISMHTSLALPLIAYFFSYIRFITIKTYLKIWVLSIIVSLLAGIQIMEFVGSKLTFVLSGDGRTEGYLSKDVASGPFRFDFIIYSALPLLLSYYYIYVKKFSDSFYEKIVKIYIIVNTFWILIIYANYTNRFASLSWFLIPMLLVYPIFKDKFLIKKQPSFLLKIIFFQLIFTLIMFFKDYLS